MRVAASRRFQHRLLAGAADLRELRAQRGGRCTTTRGPCERGEGRFESARGAQHLREIEIAVREGTPVKAAAAGSVAYAGDELKFTGTVTGKHEDGNRGLVDLEVHGQNGDAQLLLPGTATVSLPRRGNTLAAQDR